MEAQDYVSKIVRLEKVHRAMVTKIWVTKYLKARCGNPLLLTGSSLYRQSGRAGPERLFRSVLAASLEPTGK